MFSLKKKIIIGASIFILIALIIVFFVEIGGTTIMQRLLKPDYQIAKYEYVLFEGCSNLDNWTIVGGSNPWALGAGGDAGWCKASNVDFNTNMTSIDMNLSGLSNVNLTYKWTTSNLDGGEYLRIYINNGTTEIMLFSQEADGSATNSHVLEDNITFTSNVTIKAECTNDANNEKCMIDDVNVSDVEPSAPDLEYPIFDNYWDDNATLVGSGVGLFNITIDSTNGTVLLEINGVNITAENITADVYNASYTFSSSGDYTYRWNSWGNGSNSNFNKSDDKVYTVNATAENEYPSFSDITETPPTNTDYSKRQDYQFNTSVINTNGSVGIYLNETNITAEKNIWIEFDGENDYVQVPDQDELSIGSTINYTISFWMKPATLDFPGSTSGGYKEIMGKGTTSQHEFAFRFYNSTIANSGQVQFVAQSLSGTSASNTRTLTSLTAGQWHHIVATVNDSEISVYMDGVLRDDDVYSVTLEPGNQPLRIGAKTATGTNYFNGSMDNVIFWNKTLDRKLIRRMYNESHYGSDLGIGIPVLSYHIIRNTNSLTTVTNSTNFNATMKMLSDGGFSTVTYWDVDQYKRGNFTMPARPVIITFDDGHESVYDNASEIMDEYGFVGVALIITNRTSNPEDFTTVMNWTEVKNLSDRGWEIGSHTLDHLDLKTITPAQRLAQFNDSKNNITENIGRIPISFIYPFSSNNVTTDDECSEYYTFCSGFGSVFIETRMETYLFTNANFTHEESYPIGLRRNSIANVTNLSQIKDLVDFYDGQVLHQRLDENSGLTTYDDTVYGNNGTITNGAYWNRSNFWVNVRGLLAGNYTYHWWAYGNGTENLYNTSLNQSYTVEDLAPPGDTCTCAGLDTSWEIDHADSCVVNDACNLGTGTLSFIGTGTTTCNANINISDLGDPGSGGIFKINSNCEVIIA